MKAGPGFGTCHGSVTGPSPRPVQNLEQQDLTHTYVRVFMCTCPYYLFGSCVPEAFIQDSICDNSPVCQALFSMWKKNWDHQIMNLQIKSELELFALNFGD